MRAAQGRSGELENRILDDFNIDAAGFKPLKASGSRRVAVLFLDDFSISPVNEGLEFRFTLPSGAYATTVMREFMRPAVS